MHMTGKCRRLVIFLYFDPDYLLSTTIPMHLLKRIFFFFLLISNGWAGLKAQAPEKLSAGEIQLALKKLNVLGSALYLAAHPDDENQVVIGYLSQELLMNTGYLSLTRGDGGQNLIGPEIGELLGVVRTEELIQARSVDGSHQFFTRAIDFGYSKSTDETLELWNKEKILSDVVWVIRKFRPDVIITRFPPDDRAGHGHHSTSAVLAAEAFDLAGDPNSYPEQLQYVEPWQPTRLMLNDTEWFTEDIEAESRENDSILTVNVGLYNPLLGKSVNEIAAESRSKHQSQGFGATGNRGKHIEYFRLVKGKRPEQGLFDGINTTWSSIKGGEAIGDLVKKAYENFQPEDPAAIVPTLMQASEALKGLKNDYWQRVKRTELNKVIAACMGLYLETRTGTNVLGRRRGGEPVPGIAEYAAAPGDTITLNVEVINRSDIAARLNKVSFTSIDRDTTINLMLHNNVDSIFQLKAVIPQDITYSGPYWLKKPHDGFTFTVDDQALIGLDETQPVIEAHYAMTIDGKPIEFVRPVIYKRNDPRSGETYQPFVITPPVYVNIPEKVTVYANEEPKPLSVQVKAGSANIKGKVSLDLPEGWKSEPEVYDFSLPLKGQDASFSFKLFPPKGQSTGQVIAKATVDDKTYDQSLVVIDYPHIPTQTLFPTADARLVKLDIEKQGNMIGYIMGAGDEIPEALEQIGYQVTPLLSSDLRPAYLENMDAIIIGIRAYNTEEWLRYKNNILLQYVENGGTLIVQYNTSHSLVTKNFAPYPLELSRDRVTDETSAVKFLAPNHPLLNTPNKITQDDFEGWVQERGLYFPDKWNEHYQPILSMHDKGEEPLKGSLLVAPYGKGYYIYTGLSLFRELPAGVPGAYRLLTNMISIGQHRRATPSAGKEKGKKEMEE